MAIGRPSKLTTRTRRIILRELRAGVSQRRAAVKAGISWDTLGRWLTLGKGRTGREPYRSFRREVQAAKVAPLADLERCVFKSGKRDARTALQILAIRCPKRWAKPQQIEHSGTVGVKGLGDLLAEAFPDDAGKE